MKVAGLFFSIRKCPIQAHAYAIITAPAALCILPYDNDDDDDDDVCGSDKAMVMMIVIEVITVEVTVVE